MRRERLNCFCEQTGIVLFPNVYSIPYFPTVVGVLPPINAQEWLFCPRVLDQQDGGPPPGSVRQSPRIKDIRPVILPDWEILSQRHCATSFH